MSPVTLPGDLVSPVAGPLLRRGCPVIVRFDAHAAISGVCLLNGVVAVRDGGLADIYEVGEGGELYDVTPEQVALDLSDPAGMDRAARWLAAHHGLTVGATAPGWNRTPTGRGVDEDMGGWWNMWTSRGIVFADFQKAELGGSLAHIVPGISTITDPAEALRAACLATLQTKDTTS